MRRAPTALGIIVGGEEEGERGNKVKDEVKDEEDILRER